MGYEVTATRRRPQRFEDMIGQDFVVATLQKSISAGKIAPAYLFSGPRGCGKTSSARILAKALNCETGPGGTPCGTCPACVEITRGGSLDVIEIDGASNTSVNDVRQIKEEVQFPPNSCRYKVYIIDEVHMLSTSAFNALLKTIEEPPPYVIFIFATTELHKVPATIKSRCQQFNFRLVSVDELKHVLGEAAVEMGVKADDEALFWIAREATGSVRDAYTLFDQVTAFSDGYITFEKIRDKLGLVGIDSINRIIEACAERNAQVALTYLDEILDAGVSVEQFTVDTADYFRNMLLIRNGIQKESLLGQNAERFSAKVLQLWLPIQLERALGLMLQLFRDIRYSLEPRYELELAISRLSWISDYVSSAEMKTAIKQAQNLLQKGSASQGAVQQGRSGPFNEADRFDGQVMPEAVRETLPQSEGEQSVESPDAEVYIENPFAEFKQRMNGNRFEKATNSLESTSVCDALPDLTSSIQDEKNEISEPVVSISIVPFAELKDKIIEYFQESKNMVAASLSQTFDWIESGELVRFSVEKHFVRNFLEQEHRLIAESVSRLLGRPCNIEIILDASRLLVAGKSAELNTVPPQVEMLRHVFKGTIISEVK